MQIRLSDQIKLKELLDLYLAEFSRGNSPVEKILQLYYVTLRLLMLN